MEEPEKSLLILSLFHDCFWINGSAGTHNYDGKETILAKSGHAMITTKKVSLKKSHHKKVQNYLEEEYYFFLAAFFLAAFFGSGFFAAAFFAAAMWFPPPTGKGYIFSQSVN